MWAFEICINDGLRSVSYPSSQDPFEIPSMLLVTDLGLSFKTVTLGVSDPGTRSEG